MVPPPLTLLQVILVYTVYDLSQGLTQRYIKLRFTQGPGVIKTLKPIDLCTSSSPLPRRELMLPIAERLGIPLDRVFANRMPWQVWQDQPHAGVYSDGVLANPS